MTHHSRFTIRKTLYISRRVEVEAILPALFAVVRACEKEGKKALGGERESRALIIEQTNVLHANYIGSVE